MHKDWKAVALKKTTHDAIKAFQILAISKTGKMLTQSEAVDFALQLATEKLNEGSRT